MILNLSINDTLLEQALEIGEIETKNDMINLALEEFIKSRTRENIISLFNTVEYDNDYDYKKLRGKR